ncbi:MAG TPA: TIGR02922 family protein [Colwellia sp.]|nr:TIGR02922 family protein [Colwellia sp.]|tara:strand:- start:1942 stop:2172 length:231 start_codon:yes stop_codon:yes gene_type:complete
MGEAKRKVTVIYCCDDDLSIYKKTQSFNLNAYGDMVIPHDFKRRKTIVAVCDGDIDITNSVDDKLLEESGINKAYT